jgi:predicted permease
MPQFKRLFRFPWRTPQQIDDEVDAEVQFHLDMRTRELMEQGLSRDAAEAEARHQFGNVSGATQYCQKIDSHVERRSRWTRLFDELRQDVTYGTRTLRKAPGFTATVVITLALGIGVNTTIFSLTDAVLFKPLPGIRDPHRLIALYGDNRETANVEYQGISYPDSLDYRELDEVLADLAVFFRIAFIVAGDDSPEEVVGEVVSGTYFSVLGTTPEVGRLLTPADDRPDAPLVTVISYRLWQQRFSGNPAVVGQTITLNDDSWTIVGVAPRAFHGPLLDWYGDASVDVFVPMHTVDRHPLLVNTPYPSLVAAREWIGPQAIGRLAPGVSIDAARTALATRAQQLEVAYPATNEGRALLVRSAQQARFWPGRYAENVRLLSLLNASTVLLLLVACLNVANVSLTRALSRRREMAVRKALGAGRRRLVRLLVVEGVLLTLCSAAAGLGVAWVLTKGLAAYPTPFDVPLYQELDLDTRALAFTLGLAAMTGIAVGLIPALTASGRSLGSALEGRSSGLAAVTRVTGRQLLVTAQVAISLVVLVAAGLFGRSLYHLARVDAGWNPENLVVVTLDLHRTALVAYGEDELGRQFYVSLLDQIQAMPEVASVSLERGSPLSGMFGTLQVTPPDQAAPQSLSARMVGPRYFEALKQPLLRGRDFTATESDDRDTVVINDALARQLWSDQDPTGQELRIAFGGEDTMRRVIGVARNAAHRTLRDVSEPIVYFPLFGRPVRGQTTLLVRTHTSTPDVVPRLREEIDAYSPRIIVIHARPMQDDIRAHLSRERLATTVAVVLGVITVLLVAVGIFGLFAFIVRQRAPELGIRMALGADRRRLGREVLTGALRLTLVGVGAGVVMWGSVHSVIASEIYGIASNDPLTISLMAGVLILISLCAAFHPARRATRVDPMTVLQAE